MNKIFTLTFLLILVSSCKTITIPCYEYDIKVKSKIIEKHKIIKSVFKQGKYFKYESIFTNFYGKDTIHNFNLSFEKKPFQTSSSDSLISKMFKDNYQVEIYKTYNDIKQLNKKNEYTKLIVIYKSINGIFITLTNDDNFESKTSEEFLLEKFKEIEFRFKLLKKPNKMKRTLE